jgi:hypothetical protein
MPRKPTEIPPAVARSFVEDMRLYHATKDGIKRDEIAARQAWLLRERLGPREKKLRVIDLTLKQYSTSCRRRPINREIILAP